ncbi:MAG: RES family NAD+ phosphorylase [Actinobacteria bacterium]|nr:RES family NAD+ phosphorylase [Actinomycetota bacterium]
MNHPAAWPRMAAVSYDDTHRLIPGQYTEQAEHALSALADDQGELDFLVQLAAVTNSRIQAQEERHPAGLSREDMTFGTLFSKIVNAAFAYPGEGARFHRAIGKGAWYCALDLDTSVAEVAHHRIRHLAETGLRDEVAVPYRLFLADIHGQDFAHLDDGSPATRACLDPDSHTAGQDLGARLATTTAGGVVYPSVRRPPGQCVAVLVAPLVSNVRREAPYHLTIADGRLAHVARMQSTTTA